MNKIFVYVSVAMNLLGTVGVRDMMCYLDTLGGENDGLRDSVVETLIEKLVLLVNSAVEFSDKVSSLFR